MLVHTNANKQHVSCAFTLIELLVVISIISLLISILLPLMRLFALRAGIEDYVLLHLLSQAVETASEKNKTYIAQLTEQARTKLEHSDLKSIGQWRRKTLEFLDELPRG